MRTMTLSEIGRYQIFYFYITLKGLNIYSIHSWFLPGLLFSPFYPSPLSKYITLKNRHTQRVYVYPEFLAVFLSSWPNSKRLP